MAGINSCRKIGKGPPFVLRRSEAYIGVLIDDLITKGTNEPYRLFTSRAEFRLLLRQDNADERLMHKGHKLGLVDRKTYARTENKIKRIYGGIKSLKKIKVKKYTINDYLEKEGKAILKESTNFYTLIKRPEFNFEILQRLTGQNLKYTKEEKRRIEIIIKYNGYIKKQQEAVGEFNKMEYKRIPENTDYSFIKNLSNEAKEKLDLIKPETIGQANRISGVSPSDIQILLLYIGHDKK
jgi:tRNA uridine 5-carboxymethylaminomethyl modification enzyme